MSKIEKLHVGRFLNHNNVDGGILKGPILEEKIGIIGLGYVGLPLAVGFGKQYRSVVGFDVNLTRVNELCRGVDRNADVPEQELKQSSVSFTSNLDDLRDLSAYIVAVPTPIDEDNRPDLRHLLSASQTIGQVISRGDIVVFESTVYPGVTEEICAPEIERVSGLKACSDFHIGYSPERINPGDTEHTLETIVKVVSGDCETSLERVARLYGKVVKAGIFKASSIKVAEAAKVIENTQRDLNIALMNELSIIFDRIGISTQDVLAAAGTKWNFLKFYPGLVGGHCIGVDPYYLTAKAERSGYIPQVILAGRRINDGMGIYVANRMVKLISSAGFPVRGSRVGILGVTFKENVSDIRNSRVPDIVRELNDFGVETLVYDPLASAEEIREEYGIEMVELKDLKKLDGVVVAVAHDDFRGTGKHEILKSLKERGVLFDIKSVFAVDEIPTGIRFTQL